MREARIAVERIGDSFRHQASAFRPHPLGGPGNAAIAGHRAVAIGGIDAGNAGALYAAGLEGVAVVSAICAAADPGAATRAIAAVMRAQRTAAAVRGA